VQLTTICLTLLTLYSTVPATATSEPLYPDSLLNWLRIIESNDFTLLSASSQHGYYLAVKMDANGGILFCDYEHSSRSRNNPRNFSLAIRDAEGNDLHDFDSKKKSPDAVDITYPKSSRVSLGRTSSSVTIAYSAGVLYPLRKHNHTAVRIQYIETLKDGTMKMLFDQLVPLPKTTDEAFHPADS